MLKHKGKIIKKSLTALAVFAVAGGGISFQTPHAYAQNQNFFTAQPKEGLNTSTVDGLFGQYFNRMIRWVCQRGDGSNLETAVVTGFQTTPFGQVVCKDITEILFNLPQGKEVNIGNKTATSAGGEITNIYMPAIIKPLAGATQTALKIIASARQKALEVTGSSEFNGNIAVKWSNNTITIDKSQTSANTAQQELITRKYAEDNFSQVFGGVEKVENGEKYITFRKWAFAWLPADVNPIVVTSINSFGYSKKMEISCQEKSRWTNALERGFNWLRQKLPILNIWSQKIICTPTELGIQFNTSVTNVTKTGFTIKVTKEWQPADTAVNVSWIAMWNISNTQPAISSTINVWENIRRQVEIEKTAIEKEAQELEKWLEGVTKRDARKILKEQLGIKWNGSAPAGAVVPFYRNSCPEGWAEANGQNGTPDLRGYFVRGKDSSRSLGSTQEDAMQRMTGQLSVVTRWQHTAKTIDGVFESKRILNTNIKAFGDYDGWGDVVEFDSSKVVRTADETRPRNVALLYCMKLEEPEDESPATSTNNGGVTNSPPGSNNSSVVGLTPKKWQSKYDPKISYQGCRVFSNINTTGVQMREWQSEEHSFTKEKINHGKRETAFKMTCSGWNITETILYDGKLVCDPGYENSINQLQPGSSFGIPTCVRERGTSGSTNNTGNRGGNFNYDPWGPVKPVINNTPNSSVQPIRRGGVNTATPGGNFNYDPWGPVKPVINNTPNSSVQPIRRGGVNTATPPTMITVKGQWAWATITVNTPYTGKIYLSDLDTGGTVYSGTITNWVVNLSHLAWSLCSSNDFDAMFSIDGKEVPHTCV